ncbi:MAG: hypothetical protein AB8G14_00495 [Ilumatobacter sp.]
MIGQNDATTSLATGVFGTTSSPDGTGVFAQNTATTGNSRGLTALTFSPTGIGVEAITTGGSGVKATATTGNAVLAEATTGTAVRAAVIDGVAVRALADAGTALVANANAGNGIDVAGSNGVGVVVNSNIASLLLGPSGADPTTRTDAHVAGEIYLDTENNLWLCTADGTPGTWQQLNVSAPIVPPAFTPFSPFRVYDSRNADGALASGESRSVSVKDQVDVSDGSVVKVDSVPAGTSAIAFNITVTGTSGRGFLAVTPATATEFSASTINWGSTGDVLANSTFTTLDSQAQIKVFAGGPAGSQTDFIIDVVGIVG